MEVVSKDNLNVLGIYKGQWRKSREEQLDKNTEEIKL